MSAPRSAPDGGPYPDPRTAFMLTIATFVATGLIGVFFLGLGPIVAIGIGQALAVGAIATLAARRIPEPQAERIGLRSFDPRALPVVLCLVPAVLLASELDNYASDWSPAVAEEAADEAEREPNVGIEPLAERPDAEEIADPADRSQDTRDPIADADPAIDPADAAEARDEATTLDEISIDLDDPWVLAQAFVIAVGITPIVEEFFFRGVLLQSLVTRLGLARGVGFVALLYTLPHLPAVATLPRFLAGIVSAFGIGYLLGLVRIATGSILGSILLASLSAGVGIFSYAVRDRLPLPGMNVEGTHLPVTITLASLLIVAWASRAIYEEAQRRFASERAPTASAHPPTSIGAKED